MPITPITPADIQDWLFRSTPTKPRNHVPHRIRALWANLASLDQRQKSSPESISSTRVQRIRRRCETDAIWEGRIAALRWLIEFIEIKPAPKHEKDACKASDFYGAVPFSPGKDLDDLADYWMSCTKATSHATHASGHTDLNDAVFDKARTLICSHLNATIYKNLKTTVEDEALQPD